MLAHGGKSPTRHAEWKQEDGGEEKGERKGREKDAMR